MTVNVRGMGLGCSVTIPAENEEESYFTPPLFPSPNNDQELEAREAELAEKERYGGKSCTTVRKGESSGGKGDRIVRKRE